MCDMRHHVCSTRLETSLCLHARPSSSETERKREREFQFYSCIFRGVECPSFVQQKFISRVRFVDLRMHKKYDGANELVEYQEHFLEEN